MISLSDAVLMVAATALLIMGVFRWQGNMNVNPVIATPSSINQPASSSNSVQGATQNNQNTNAARVVTDNTPTTVSDVANDNTTANDNNAVDDLPALGTYSVQAGDSLSRIAITFGTSVEALQEINEIEGTLIRVGQELFYPLTEN